MRKDATLIEVIEAMDNIQYRSMTIDEQLECIGLTVDNDADSNTCGQLINDDGEVLDVFYDDIVEQIDGRKNLTQSEVREVALNLNWGNPYDDPEDFIECLRVNWEEPLSEKSVQEVYKEMCKVWDEKHLDVEVLMQDYCTEDEAKYHLKNGTTVFEGEEDFEKYVESYIREWGCDEELSESLRKMGATKGKYTVPGWGFVELRGKRYYIEYVL